MQSEETRYYNLDRSAKSNEVEEVIFEWLNDLRRIRGLRELDKENKLVLVARELAQTLTFEKNIERREIKKLFWSNGITEAQMAPYSIIVSGSLKQVLVALKSGITRALLNEVTDTEYNLTGAGMVEENGEYKTGVLLVKRYADMEPFPKVVMANDAKVLSLKILPNYNKPNIYLTTPNGKVNNIDVEKVQADQYRSFITFPTARGRYEIELMVSTKMGPVVANLFPVFLNTDINYNFITEARNQSEKFNSILEVEKELFRLCNIERTKLSLLPLKYSEELANLARGHSEDMVKRNYFAHQINDNENLQKRVARTNIDYVKIGENIAKNKSISEAHDNLMQSPAHRINILDPAYRHIGIGVVKKANPDNGGIYYITQNFAILHEALNPLTAKKNIYDGILKLRQDNKLGSMSIDKELERVAEYFSNKMRENGILSTNIGGENLLSKAKEEIPSLKSLTSVILKTRNIKQVIDNKINIDSRFDKIGCGITLDGNKKDIWIVLIVAK